MAEKPAAGAFKGFRVAEQAPVAGSWRGAKGSHSLDSGVPRTCAVHIRARERGRNCDLRIAPLPAKTMGSSPRPSGDEPRWVADIRAGADPLAVYEQTYDAMAAGQRRGRRLRRLVAPLLFGLAAMG